MWLTGAAQEVLIADYRVAFVSVVYLIYARFPPCMVILKQPLRLHNSDAAL